MGFMLFGGLALIGGILLGVLLILFLNPAAGDVAKLQGELDQARSEMDSYKASVNSHFNKTSDLVNELTQDYVKVYRHLAEGAQTLSETREFTQVLDQPSGRVLISVEAEEQVTDSLEAQAEQPIDPLEAGADQASVVVGAGTPDEAGDTTAAEQVAAEDDTPEKPVDYARDDKDDAVTEEVLDSGTESVEASVKGEAENVAAKSADEVVAGKDVSTSAVDAEPQAVVEESETESVKKA